MAEQQKDVDDVEPEEDMEDLFGSEDEAAPEAPASGGGGAADAAEPAKDADADDMSERDLFGSEEEGEDIDEKELFGSEEEGEQDKDKLPPKSPLYPASEVSQMDEAEIFGDVSDEDEEPEKVEDVVLLRRPAPPTEREFVAFRLPNVISVENEAFKAESIRQTLLEGYKEFKNTRGLNAVKLNNPENCIRWRFRKGTAGQMLTDEVGRPKYESNSRIVEWEDGSKTLHIGGEIYNLSTIEDRIQLYEKNSQDLYVCHGNVNKRIVATPQSLSSATHEALKRSQYRKYEATRRSIMMEKMDAEDAQQALELEKQDKKRRELKQKAIGEESGITAAFLDDDDGGDGENVGDLKRAYKSEAGRPAKRQKNED
eukprot:TRINITY_DN65849_c0_g1_i1.p1 TRINITY_DN65849_c0_g1~~TRINITY_DN65849_c0_g1_i1.p1  ORF type:complete len:407 (+),score=110.96 TRINITY_DN65849_c0_g1_i1:114-1223(+)